MKPGWIEDLCQLERLERFDLDRVASLMAGCELDPQQLRELGPEKPEPGQYKRHPIFSCDQFEVIVLRWSPESATPPHDHGCDESCGVVTVVEGAIANCVYQRRGEDLVESRREVIPAGQSLAFGKGLIHQMESAFAGGESLSVHVYFPRLKEVQYF